MYCLNILLYRLFILLKQKLQKKNHDHKVLAQIFTDHCLPLVGQIVLPQTYTIGFNN